MKLPSKMKTPISILNLTLLAVNILGFASLVYYEKHETTSDSTLYVHQVNELDRMYPPKTGKR